MEHEPRAIGARARASTAADASGLTRNDKPPQPGAARALRFGETPVPWTVSWSAETSTFLAPCPYAGGRIALCQPEAPGEGKPLFGRPHMNRQRQAVALCLCDLCGLPLDRATKVSLSHAHARQGGDGPAIVQYEPLLHFACAAESLRCCPSLKRDAASGALRVRQVHRWRAQIAVMTEACVERETGQRRTAIGFAAVELLRWTARHPAWLEGEDAA